MIKVPEIKELDRSFVTSAKQRLASLAIPEGALGQLGELAIELMTFTKSTKPDFCSRRLFLCAADHGIASQGVSKYPQVSSGIVSCAQRGGAVINALCRANDCDLTIVDSGLLREVDGVKDLCVRRGGTRDFSIDAAMTETECRMALKKGVELGLEAQEDLILLGEIGIGNTSSAAAIFAKIFNLNAREITGAGTGVQEAQLEKKISLIQQALNRVDLTGLEGENRAFEIMRQLGGYELAMLSGICLGAASQGKLVVLDGFLSASAALLAIELNPLLKDYLLGSHLGAEQGHRLQVEKLGIKTYLDLGLRLGEGSGAVLMLNLIDSACAILESTMTLDEVLNA